MTTSPAPIDEKLLPCPFCASKNIDREGWMGGQTTEERRVGPACDDCGATAETIARWNTRFPAPPASGDLRERLDEALRVSKYDYGQPFYFDPRLRALALDAIMPILESHCATGATARFRDALETISEGCDSGRHDGLPEDGPIHDAATMFAIARNALDTEATQVAPRASALRALATPSEADGLHPRTLDLVLRFTNALAAKLRKSEIKYGYSDGWADPNWHRGCVRDLARHVEKGDPLDVAAFAAFCFHHGWSTTPSSPAGGVPPERVQVKTSSYEVTGTVLARFKNSKGDDRAVVEFDQPNGLLHIHNPSQLSPLTASPSQESVERDDAHFLKSLSCELANKGFSYYATRCQEIAERLSTTPPVPGDVIERERYEVVGEHLNQTEDLLSDVLAWMEGDKDYENAREGILTNLRAYFEARRGRTAYQQHREE